MTYFFHPIRLSVAVVQIFHYVIIRSRRKHFTFAHYSLTFGITTEYITVAVVARGFIHLATPAVEDRYVVVGKIFDVIDDEIIVHTIAVGGYPLINNYITGVDVLFFDFS